MHFVRNTESRYEAARQPLSSYGTRSGLRHIERLSGHSHEGGAAPASITLHRLFITGDCSPRISTLFLFFSISNRYIAGSYYFYLETGAIGRLTRLSERSTTLRHRLLRLLTSLEDIPEVSHVTFNCY